MDFRLQTSTTIGVLRREDNVYLVAYRKTMNTIVVIVEIELPPRLEPASSILPPSSLEQRQGYPTWQVAGRSCTEGVGQRRNRTTVLPTHIVHLVIYHTLMTIA